MGNLAKQQGIVLVAAMLMILMVSGIAVTVMSGSAVDSKMVNATQDAYRAESVARGETDKAIKTEIDAKAANKFLIKKKAYPNSQSLDLTVGNTTMTLTNENRSNVVDLLDCPPRFAPTPGIKCNYLKLTTAKKYGKGDKHTITLNTGIEQEMIGGL